MFTEDAALSTITEPLLSINDQETLSTIKSFLQVGDTRNAIDLYSECVKRGQNYQFILYALLTENERKIALQIGLPIYNPFYKPCKQPVNYQLPGGNYLKQDEYSLVAKKNWKDAKSMAKGITNPFLQELVHRFVLIRQQEKTRADIEEIMIGGAREIGYAAQADYFFLKHPFNPATETNIIVLQRRVHWLVNRMQFDEAITLTNTLKEARMFPARNGCYEIIIKNLINRGLFVESHQLLTNKALLNSDLLLIANYSKMWVFAYIDKRSSQSIENGMGMAIELATAISNKDICRDIKYATLQACMDLCSTEKEKEDLEKIMFSSFPHGDLSRLRCGFGPVLIGSTPS